MAFSQNGSVRIGATPKTILADGTGGGSEPGYYDTSKLGNLLRTIEEIQVKEQMKQEKALKQKQDQSDMYKTLRDSGYTPQKAYESVVAGNFPDMPGGQTAEEEKAAMSIKKTQAETNKIEAETDKVKKETTKLGVTSADLRSRIMNKVSSGETLTAGEQKVYDEVIRKYGQKADLESVLNNKVNNTNNVNKADYVPMVNPAGQNKLVPKGNVEKAKAKGWKLR